MEYSKAFSVESITWWKNELRDLKKKETNAQFFAEKLSAKRLLAYISLMSYSYVNATISQENWKASAQYLQIYGIADPENPDYYYFLTCYLANTGYSQEAIMTLKKSLELGFSDHFKLVNDPLLDKLRALPEFGELIK
jgi:predicted Zn-dependent protease